MSMHMLTHKEYAEGRQQPSLLLLQGIIHRDLKANNIFLCAGGILKLGDFGISKALGENQQAARTMVGTPYYMSPEILKVGRQTPAMSSRLPSLLALKFC